MVCGLLVALALCAMLVDVYRAKTAMTQRERYSTLAFVFAVLMVLEASMLGMSSVAWRFAGYFATVVTVIVCLIVLARVRRNPAEMRRALKFTRHQRYIGTDGNLYLRTCSQDGDPEFTLIATYP